MNLELTIVHSMRLDWAKIRLPNPPPVNNLRKSQMTHSLNLNVLHQKRANRLKITHLVISISIHFQNQIHQSSTKYNKLNRRQPQLITTVS